MRFTRFEKKILLAMFLVAWVPFVASLLIGRGALREAFKIGVRPKVGMQLRDSLRVYRAYFAVLRQNADLSADVIARDVRLREAITDGTVKSYLKDVLEHHPNIVWVKVIDGSNLKLLGEANQRGHGVPAAESRFLTLEENVPGPNGSLRVEVTAAAPASDFERYQRAGQVAELFERLEQNGDYVSNLLLRLYIVLVLAVIIVALAVGTYLSRRVTKRIVHVAQATRHVAAGDLNVEVPLGSNDEIGELTQSFNSMVKALRESRERIQYLQRMSAWQEFARLLAHEIKNPLTPIQLAAQEMHESYKGDDVTFRRKLADARSIIEEEVATLRHLVGTFSTFAKLPEVQLTSADLGDFLKDLERMVLAIGDEVANSKVEFKFERPTVPIPALIDPIMLKRVIDNLVRNAIQAVIAARPTGGEVIVAAYRDHDIGVLEVRDNGPGVPEAERCRVFEPYFTTKDEGTGLGLAIVKKIVLEHGGEVRYEVAKEGGAAFRIHIPLQTAGDHETSLGT